MGPLWRLLLFLGSVWRCVAALGGGGGCVIGRITSSAMATLGIDVAGAVVATALTGWRFGSLWAFACCWWGRLNVG